MGLFRKSKADREEDDDREELKSQIENLMSEYDEEEIDGETYFQKMMDLSTSYQKKHKR